MYSDCGTVKFAEWCKVEGALLGKPPCARIGHSLSYMPLSRTIVVAGGRNDEISKGMVTPFLNDIHLFSLEQKQW